MEVRGRGEEVSGLRREREVRRSERSCGEAMGGGEERDVGWMSRREPFDTTKQTHTTRQNPSTISTSMTVQVYVILGKHRILNNISCLKGLW